MDCFDEDRFGSRDVLDCLAGHRFGQEADEVTRVAGFHRHADLAVRLEAADPGPVTRARIDYHKRTTLDINLHSARRGDPHEPIIYRPLEISTVDDQLDIIVENVRCGLGDMFAVLNAAPAHDIQEQDAALPGIHEVFVRRMQKPQAACGPRWLAAW
jgi:hypothetical protein